MKTKRKIFQTEEITRTKFKTYFGPDCEGYTKVPVMLRKWNKSVFTENQQVVFKLLDYGG